MVGGPYFAHVCSINREETHRDDSGVVGQKVPWSDVTRLVFSTSNIQRQLNRTLGTEIITGTVLQQDHIMSWENNPQQQTSITDGVVSNRKLCFIPDDCTLTLEYCILSTTSSLVRGMRPDDTGNDSVVTAAFTYCKYISNYYHQPALKADHNHCDTYQLCVQQTHRAALMNWRRSESSQSLKIKQNKFNFMIESHCWQEKERATKTLMSNPAVFLKSCHSATCQLLQLWFLTIMWQQITVYFSIYEWYCATDAGQRHTVYLYLLMFLGTAVVSDWEDCIRDK